MTFRNQVRQGWMRIAASLLVVVGLFGSVGMASASSQPRDKDANALMWGGCYTKSECLNKINNGDGYHSSVNLKQIYYNEGRGVSEGNFNSASTVDGVVYKDGRIVVNGQVVATKAVSTGRSYMSGSWKSGSVWARYTSTSFRSDSIPAFVNMEGGVFRYAIIKSCGNWTTGTPVPKPTPSPSPTPKPSPSPSPTPTPTPTPSPSFKCVKLEATQPDSSTPTKFRFTITPQVSNVEITGYRFTFSDNTPVMDTAANKPYVEKTITSGSLKVQGQVKTSAGITAISEACSATVTVTQSPTPSPSQTPTGQVLGVTLPATGPETALAGMAGLSAMGIAARSYLRSRKSLLSSLRNKRTE